jgi:hypothetical protein
MAGAIFLALESMGIKVGEDTHDRVRAGLAPNWHTSMTKEL